MDEIFGIFSCDRHLFSHFTMQDEAPAPLIQHEAAQLLFEGCNATYKVSRSCSILLLLVVYV